MSNKIRPLFIENGQIKQMTSDDQLDWGVEPTHLANLRLSLHATDPFANDVVASGLGYLHACNGNLVSLPNIDQNWLVYQLSSPISFNIPSTKMRGFDIFLYDSLGTLTIETVDWDQATTSITAFPSGASDTIAVSSASNFQIDDIIYIDGVVGTVGADLNGFTFKIDNKVGSDLTLSGFTSANTYTSGGTIYRLSRLTRSTALETLNSRYVVGTHVYIGSGMTIGTSGQCTTDTATCFLWNLFNKIPNTLFKDGEFDSHTFDAETTATTFILNNDPTNCVQQFTGLQGLCFADINYSVGVANIDGAKLGGQILEIPAQTLSKEQQFRFDSAPSSGRITLSSRRMAKLDAGFVTYKMGMIYESGVPTTATFFGTLNSLTPTTGISMATEF